MIHPESNAPQLPFCTSDDVNPPVATPAKWLHQLFFRCPITGDRQRILDVRGAESGLAYLEIITVGPRNCEMPEQRTAWRHRIYSEEADPAKEIARAKRRGEREAKRRARHNSGSQTQPPSINQL